MKSWLPCQYQALVHGSISLLLGLLSGVLLIYSALDEVIIWPLGSWPWSLPGDVSIWRGAHAGALLNGVMCIALVAVLPALGASPAQCFRLCWSLIIMVWGNGIFYIARAWGTNRGLAMDSAQFGAGNIADALAMAAASVAMVTTFYAVIIVIKLSLSRLRSLL